MNSKTKIAKDETKIPFAKKFEINKKKVLSSLMVCGAILVMLIASAFASYFHIADRMSFAFGDFAPLYIGICLLIFAVFFVSMILTKGIAHRALFAIYSALALIGGIQNMITTFTFKGMPGDGNVARASALTQILNFGMWCAVIAVIFWFIVMSKKQDFARTVISLGLLFVMVTQAGTAFIEGVSATSKKQEAENSATSAKTVSYLTTLNMFEVSTKENVIVFVLDRFDVDYFENFLASGSDYIDELDGFTFYNDNISKYPRTFPAVTSMLTGREYDYTASRESFMSDAYSSSPILEDLKDNNYKVNLYIPFTDGYKDATVFGDKVTNTTTTKGYTVSKGELTGNIFALASYFWAPEVVKARIDISESKLNNLVTQLGDADQYVLSETSDAEYYEQFKNEGLSTQSTQNTFTFLHLRGCHSPYTIDENCEVSKENGDRKSTNLEQTTGMFKFISEYIRELKDLGLYEDATIIITGDHAALETDTKPYEEDNGKAKVTALLVKESGQSGTPLKTSTAQVSQDNFMATIVKSAGIETERYYGKAYSEIKEGETVERIHYFSTLAQNPNKVWKYTINGSGRDFSNWTREQVK